MWILHYQGSPKIILYGIASVNVYGNILTVRYALFSVICFLKLLQATRRLLIMLVLAQFLQCLHLRQLRGTIQMCL